MDQTQDRSLWWWICLTAAVFLLAVCIMISGGQGATAKPPLQTHTVDRQQAVKREGDLETIPGGLSWLTDLLPKRTHHVTRLTEASLTIGPLAPRAARDEEVMVTMPQGARCTTGVTVSPSTDAASADPGDQAVYPLDVTNTGDCEDTFDISVGGTLWPVSTPASTGPLAPSEITRVRVTITVPVIAQCGETDSALVTFTSMADGVTSDSSVLNTTANAVYGLMVEPAADAVSGNPGTGVVYTLRVTNTDNCTDTFDVALGDHAWTTEAPETVGELAPDEGADVEVSVSVPACTPGGDSDVLEVTFVSQSDGTKSDSAALTTSAEQVAPVANDDEYYTEEDTPRTVVAPGVLGNDSDPNCGACSVSWYSQPDNGTVLVDPDGSFIYTPDANFDGDDGFTYRVSDGDLTDTGTVVIHVLDSGDDPIVDAGADQSADEGEVVHFAGSFVDPARAPAAGETVHWDFGDGGTTTGTLTPSHIYRDSGKYTVTLTVTDLDGNVGQDSLVVTVDNVAPLVDAGPDRRAEPGELISFSGSFSDPGLDDTHTIEWDMGNGTIVNDTLSFEYTYENAGIYNVTLTVTDDDYGVGIDTLEITVTIWTLHLPLAFRNYRTWDPYYEENDHWLAAYGPLSFDEAYQAYPDDEEDYYYFELSSDATVNISVENFTPTRSCGQLLLYGPATGSEHPPLIAQFGQPGEETSMVLPPQSLEPGKYYVRVYVSCNYSTSQLYTLTVTY